MGLFSVKNSAHSGDFLRQFESRCHGLKEYTGDQPELTESINKLIERFTYLVPSASKEAKRQEKIIARTYKKLKKKLEKQKFEEAKPLIKKILYALNEISSMNA